MIINLTQHKATPDQREAGVCDLEEKDRENLVDLLTFDEPPTMMEMIERAYSIAAIARRYNATTAMIGGAPYFMEVLPPVLRMADIEPVYAFARRDSIEVAQPDGSVKKSTVFRHMGFVRIEKGENERRKGMTEQEQEESQS